ncbi:MAG: TIM barrel protein [Bacteroidales bacterium]|jgi:hypothetical protein
MIFISTSCVKQKHINESIIKLVQNGFKNIELSGGTEYYLNIVDDLIDLKKKYNINYILHNYFPPQKENFVLNLASLDEIIFEKTISALINSIKLSKLLSIGKFGLHAGFLIDISTDDIGKRITFSKLLDKDKALERFCMGWELIKKEADNVELYIENNVLSLLNYKNFNEQNPFLLTNTDEYLELKKQINFNLLLDIGHLKVSCNTLNLNFYKELNSLFSESNYIHLSDNNKTEDENKLILENSNMWNLLKKYNFAGKTVTLEINNNIENIKKNYELIENKVSYDKNAL